MSLNKNEKQYRGYYFFHKLGNYKLIEFFNDKKKASERIYDMYSGQILFQGSYSFKTTYD